MSLEIGPDNYISQLYAHIRIGARNRIEFSIPKFLV
jgi:hypothetical protein